MSNMYITEPPTDGKVVLRTSYGDIEIELWSREAPKACRNFLQLCMEGYYDGTIFHRIIKEFMVQGGDPTGTGKGGESIYGGPFEDEFHSRIKFNKRGQVAMANDNTPNSNTSQFFMTLGKCEWLNKKHTIFGKIVGATVFNMLRMGEAEVGKDDRPIDPPRIESTEVVHSPFDDIVPRDLSLLRKPTAAEKADESRKKKKAQRRGKKALNLLSFADEAEEAEMLTAKIGAAKMQSMHDAVDDEKLSKEVGDHGVVTKQANPSSGSDSDSDDSGAKRKRGKGSTTSKGGSSDQEESATADADAFAANMRKKLLAKRRKLDSAASGPRRKGEADGNHQGDDDKVPETIAEVQRRELEEKKRKHLQEYRELKRELQSSQRATLVVVGEAAKQMENDERNATLLTEWQQRRQQYTKRKRQHGGREADTLAKLQKFRSKLTQAMAPAAAPAPKGAEGESDDAAKVKEEGAAKGGEGEAGKGDVAKAKLGSGYAGQVLEVGDDEDDDEGWMAARLKFKRHIDDKFRVGEDDLAVYDPLAAEKPKMSDDLKRRMGLLDDSEGGGRSRGRGDRTRDNGRHNGRDGGYDRRDRDGGHRSDRSGYRGRDGGHRR